MSKVFNIRTQIPVPSRRLCAWPDTKSMRAIHSVGEPDESSPYRLLIEQRALRQLDAQLQFGRMTEQNMREQGGLLLGELCLDDQSNITFGVVSEIVEGQASGGDEFSLQWNHSAWMDMLRQADKKMPDHRLLGWYHTHPGLLDVFLSEVDIATHQKLFDVDWLFATVFQPQRLEFGVWRGRHVIPCPGWLLLEERT